LWVGRGRRQRNLAATELQTAIVLGSNSATPDHSVPDKEHHYIQTDHRTPHIDEQKARTHYRPMPPSGRLRESSLAPTSSSMAPCRVTWLDQELPPPPEVRSGPQIRMRQPKKSATQTPALGPGIAF